MDKKEQLNEVFPIILGAAAIGAASFLIQLSFVLVQYSSISKGYAPRIDAPLSKDLNNIMKDGKNWAVVKLNNPSPNASVLIGKYIFITTGLIKMLTEREVMAALLHEVSHLKNQDTIKSIAAENALFSILLGTLGVVGGPLVFVIIGGLYYILSQSGSDIIIRRTLGRKQEYKADAFTIKYGYGAEMISVLQKLDAWVQKYEKTSHCGKICQMIKKIDAFLDEHPPIKKRVEHVLKQQKTWDMLKKSSFVKVRNFFMKEFNVEEPTK